MSRLIVSAAIGSALIFGFALPRQEASAQTTGDLVGTWRLVSVTVEQGDEKGDVMGPNPKGLLMFDDGGHFSVSTFRQDLPKFASDNRLAATAEESSAVVSGSLAHYGTYSEAEDVLVFHIECSTFPNWDGTDQKGLFAISGDDLTYTTPGSTGMGLIQLVWKRVR
jgi:Lipocalin-like domain